MPPWIQEGRARQRPPAVPENEKYQTNPLFAVTRTKKIAYAHPLRTRVGPRPPSPMLPLPFPSHRQIQLAGATTGRPETRGGKSGTNIVNVCRIVGPQGGYKLMTRVMAAALGAAVLQSSLLFGADVAPKVEELLHRMTLDEKIGQLTQIGGQAFIPGAPKPEDAVRKGQAGSVLW